MTVPVLGDVGVTARRLLERRRTRSTCTNRSTSVPTSPRGARSGSAEKARRVADDRGRGVASAPLFAALARHTPEHAVIAVDVGNNTYSFGRYFECKPGQHVLMSGYLGSIGFGFPAAMGAWAAAPDRPIVAVTGDGGFGQYLAELTTAVKYGMNITHVLLNNSQLGKISKEQRAAEWDVWQTSLHNPDFAAYAQLCGALRRTRDDDAISSTTRCRGVRARRPRARRGRHRPRPGLTGVTNRVGVRSRRSTSPLRGTGSRISPLASDRDDRRGPRRARSSAAWSRASS